jgi:hypothetical protein
MADVWFSSLISYFIDDKFHPAPGLLGTVMSVTLAFAATSNIFASAIAKRIGPIKTAELPRPLTHRAYC